MCFARIMVWRCGQHCVYTVFNSHPCDLLILETHHRPYCRPSPTTTSPAPQRVHCAHAHADCRHVAHASTFRPSRAPVCVFACVHACMRACMRSCVCVSTCARVCIREYRHVCKGCTRRCHRMVFARCCHPLPCCGFSYGAECRPANPLLHHEQCCL